MSFTWQAPDDGYRAQIKLDLPAGAVVYSCNPTMVQMSPLPPLTRGLQKFGDISSANVIVVGSEKKYILAGAVTAFRSQTMLRAVFEQRRLSSIEVWQPEIRKGEKPEELVVLEGEDWRKLLCDYANIAAEKMGVAPADVAYVGDSVTDMKTGLAAGMHTIGVSWGFTAREDLVAAGAHKIADTVDELGTILASL